MKAIVRGGRLRLDEPSSLAEGTTLELVLDDDGDDLDATGRWALHDAISGAWAWAWAKSGRVRPAPVVIDELQC